MSAEEKAAAPASTEAAPPVAPAADAEERMIALVSQEGDRFTVPQSVATMSKFVLTTIEEKEDDDDDDADEDAVTEVPLPNVTSAVLAKVLEYCQHYKEDPAQQIPRPIPWPKRITDVVQRWYASYALLMDYPQLFDVILAANYLDIQPLMELLCARVGRLIQNHTPDEVRELFGIEDEFAPEEYELILNENKWSTEPMPREDMIAEPISLINELRAEAGMELLPDPSEAAVAASTTGAGSGGDSAAKSGEETKTETKPTEDG